MARSAKATLHITTSMETVLKKLWEWRKAQPEYMNVKSAGEYGRQLLLRVLLEEQREMEDE